MEKRWEKGGGWLGSGGWTLCRVRGNRLNSNESDGDFQVTFLKTALRSSQ